MKNNFKEIELKMLQDNPFKLFGTDWMLITAGTPESYNTMTASWGGLGHLWDKNVTWCFVRPKRYTYGFMEKARYYTFSFFDERYRSVLDFCGSNSGENVDKAKETGLSPLEGLEKTVYFSEARLIIISKKLYFHTLSFDTFTDKKIIEEFYTSDTAIHRMYIGEIIQCIERK